MARKAILAMEGAAGPSDEFEGVVDAPFDEAFDDGFEDGPATDADGYGLPDEVQAELEALAAAELDVGSGVEQALAQAQRDLVQQRALTRQAVERYRSALLAAEPDLPPDLVQGETLEEVDASVEAARRTVARIRERMAAERPPSPGFPVGAPARGTSTAAVLTPVEKIARGLQERLLI